MAESGDPEKPSTNVPKSQSLDALVLECPICLEQLQHPKSLPCLHSFCQECLGCSYITKELSGKMASSSSFSCPVCRKITEPVNQSEDKERWAEQFPTNSLAVEMIRHLLNTDDLLVCTPCGKKGNTKVIAKFWCKHNQSYFCADCKTNHHDLVHGNCEPENITEWNKSAAIRRKTSAVECGKHKEKLEYFCEDHQILGCYKCIIVDHRKCEVVTSADDFRVKLASGRIDSLLEELRKCVDAMDILIKDVEEQLQFMTEDQVIALDSLTDLRAKINERLDKLQKELTDKLTAAFKEETESLDISKHKCERLMLAMQMTLASSQDSALKEDTVGTISLFQRGQAEVESCKNLVQGLETSSSTTRMRHEYKPDIMALDTTNSLSMGKIIIHKQQKRLPSTAVSYPFSKRQLKLVRRFSIRVRSDYEECCSLGIVLLSADRVVVADKNNQKVKLFTVEGDFLCEVGRSAQPYDLCNIDDISVAVILVSVNTICIVTVEDSTLSILSYIHIQNATDDRVYGVTFADNSFIIGTGSSLYSVERKDGLATKLHPVKSRCLHLDNDKLNGHVFASVKTSSPGTLAVVRLSDGTYTNVLKVGIVTGALGIDVDREGNVYVCGGDSNNVIQMAGDGTNIRELLTVSDGIECPRAIALLGDQAVVTSECSTQRNLVHVFQLVNGNK
ncbi:LOW QUALITY PROTEIN: tripartite motif-containing protein 2-like [Argopecten irradians]|uniref:LOW QUALITY PROTEIN: tripartite motif-containing protein 2-like n=1 Tax=Argopecten irradians TaxID=31199 RepID=UPI0037158E0F